MHVFKKKTNYCLVSKEKHCKNSNLLFDVFFNININEAFFGE